MTPPMMTVAKGRWTSAPAPLLVAIGMNPTLATNAVIKIVRNDSIPECWIASIRFVPSFRAARIAETSTILLRTDNPESVMKPTAAEIESGISLADRAAIPPMHANGTLANVTSVSNFDRKLKNNNTTTPMAQRAPIVFEHAACFRTARPS